MFLRITTLKYNNKVTIFIIIDFKAALGDWIFHAYTYKLVKNKHNCSSNPILIFELI